MEVFSAQMSIYYTKKIRLIYHEVMLPYYHMIMKNTG